MSIFTNRRDAGRRLGEKLMSYKQRNRIVVLGLPRGGIPVAKEVAEQLEAPLDVFSVRKLGAPSQPELAFGAIATGGVRVLNQEVVDMLGIDEETVENVTEREREELDRREKAYREETELVQVEGKTVILVDDGLATGATMRAAVSAIRTEAPAHVIVAVPVAPAETRDRLRSVADEVICLATPQPFYGVGAWYDDFRQTTDDQVREALAEARAWSASEEETNVPDLS